MNIKKKHWEEELALHETATWGTVEFPKQMERFTPFHHLIFLTPALYIIYLQPLHAHGLQLVSILRLIFKDSSPYIAIGTATH